MLGSEKCTAFTMHQVRTNQITTDKLHEHIGIRSIEYCIRLRTLRSVGHVARMDKTAAASAPQGMGSEFSIHWGHRDDLRPFRKALDLQSPIYMELFTPSSAVGS
jgi:hypothetical protein